MSNTDTPAAAAPLGPVVIVEDVSHRYGKVVALDHISLEVPSGLMVGVVGPDGVGKSTLLALIAGSKKMQRGKVTVLGGDIASRAHRREACPRIAYMPQGLGKNLYLDLSVRDNVWLEGSAGVFTGSSLDVIGRLTRREFAYARLKVFF